MREELERVVFQGLFSGFTAHEEEERRRDGSELDQVSLAVEDCVFDFAAFEVGPDVDRTRDVACFKPYLETELDGKIGKEDKASVPSIHDGDLDNSLSRGWWWR